MPQYQFKFMQSQHSQSSQVSSKLDSQNSNVTESPVRRPLNNEASKNESCRKNLELLRSILLDYTDEELNQEIFTLHDVSLTAPKKGG